MDAQETLKLLKAEVQSIACWGPRGGKQYFDADGDERELVLDLIDRAIAGTLHLPPPRSESRRPARVRASRSASADN